MRATVVVALIGLAGIAVVAGRIRAGSGGDGVALAAPEGTGGIAGGCTPSTGPDVIVGQLNGRECMEAVIIFRDFAVCVQEHFWHLNLMCHEEFLCIE